MPPRLFYIETTWSVLCSFRSGDWMAYLALQEPTCRILSSRFASLSSLRGGKNVPVWSLLRRSRTRSSCGLWLPFPPSSKVWTIDSSWSLKNSSLVYLDGDYGLCPFGSTSPQTVQKSPASSRGFFVNQISSSVPLASYPGPRMVTLFLVPIRMFRWRLLWPCLRDQWDFLDDQFQVSRFPLCRELLP